MFVECHGHYQGASLLGEVNLEGEPMKPSTEDQVKGNYHEVKGKVKEKIGQHTNDPETRDEGTDEKVAGKVQKKIGQIEKVFEK